MKIILLCKGNSINQLTKEEILWVKNHFSMN